MGDKFFNILGAIVTVALVTAVVQSPNSATVITSLGEAFKGSIGAALNK